MLHRGSSWSYQSLGEVYRVDKEGVGRVVSRGRGDPKNLRLSLTAGSSHFQALASRGKVPTRCPDLQSTLTSSVLFKRSRETWVKH